MFITQENVTLYPFLQINFCVTSGIKGLDRWELKDGEMKNWKWHGWSVCDLQEPGQGQQCSPAMPAMVQQLAMLA